MRCLTEASTSNKTERAAPVRLRFYPQFPTWKSPYWGSWPPRQSLGWHMHADPVSGRFPISPALMQPVSNNCHKTWRLNRDKWCLSFSNEFRFLLFIIWRKRTISWLILVIAWKLFRDVVSLTVPRVPPFHSFDNPSTPLYFLFTSCQGWVRHLPVSTYIYLVSFLFPGFWTLSVHLFLSFCSGVVSTVSWFTCSTNSKVYHSWDLLVYTVWKQSQRQWLLLLRAAGKGLDTPVAPSGYPLLPVRLQVPGVWQCIVMRITLISSRALGNKSSLNGVLACCQVDCSNTVFWDPLQHSLM